jgi:uncharacterized membrane protein
MKSDNMPQIVSRDSTPNRGSKMKMMLVIASLVLLSIVYPPLMIVTAGVAIVYGGWLGMSAMRRPSGKRPRGGRIYYPSGLSDYSSGDGYSGGGSDSGSSTGGDGGGGGYDGSN